MDTPEEPSGRPDEELVILREYASPMEAEWARTLLASAGICCLIPDSNFNYLVTPVVPIRVQVPASKKDEAEAILQEQELHLHLLNQGEHPPQAGENEEGQGPSEALPEFEAEVAGVVDPHDLCPVPPPILCPACGADEADPSPPPDYAAVSALGDLLNRLSGHGWFRCGSCGAVWEREKRNSEDEIRKREK